MSTYEKLLQLKSLVESQKDRFCYSAYSTRTMPIIDSLGYSNIQDDINDVGHVRSVLNAECGSLACLAGWCATLTDEVYHYDVVSNAQIWLGITSGEANCLFRAGRYDDIFKEIYPIGFVSYEEAMQRLDFFIEKYRPIH